MATGEFSKGGPEKDEKAYADFMEFVRAHMDHEFPAGEGEAKTTYKARGYHVYTPMPVDEVVFSINHYQEVAGAEEEWGLYTVTLRGHGLDMYRMVLDQAEHEDETYVDSLPGGDDEGYRFTEGAPEALIGFQASVTELLGTGVFEKVVEAL